MILTIKGRVISKKNNNQIIRIGKRFMIATSKTYRKFEKDAVAQLKEQYKGEPLKSDVFVDYTFHLKGKGNQDADNLQGSINDILQRAGVIENDKQIRSGRFDVLIGCEEYETAIIVVVR